MPLTNLLLASKNEAQKIADSNIPTEEWMRIDTKGIDVVAYSVLYSILLKQEWQTEVIDEFPLISEETQEGPWVTIFPDKMKTILSSLDDNELNLMAHSWSETDEISGIKFSEIKNLLYEIRNLAKQAGLTNKDILILMSL